MDFSFDEEQQAVSDLAAQILEGQLGHDALKEHEASGEPYPIKVWEELAKAGLLGIALPAEHGGAGLDLVAAGLVLEQVGRTTAPIPYLASVVLGALPVAEYGSDELQAELLPGVADGSTVLTAAMHEEGTTPARPMVEASADGDGWTLNGTKSMVPFGLQSDRILVPARVGEDGVAVFVVASDAAGLSQEPLDTTSGLPESHLVLSDVTVAAGQIVGDVERGSEIVEWMVQRATAALCATAVGVCAEALHLTAEYTKTREQFDKPIASFQAVGQRAADAFIDTEAVRLTAWQAVWRLSEGLPAAEQVAVAKFWTAEGGQRVVHAAQHLHGGMGVDRDYPLHRYFLWAKQLELTLGGSTRSLLDLGARIAEEPV